MRAREKRNAPPKAVGEDREVVRSLNESLDDKPSEAIDAA
jgi:hypothetical protein